jgi:type III secretion system low calcium response chaperone LcrH/SycD
MSTLLENTDEESLRNRSAEIVEKILGEGQDLYEAAGLKVENLEALYQVGHSYYVAGDYADAETIFSTLCLYNVRNRRNWLALGGAAQAQRKYEAAVIAYSFAQLLDLEDPESVVRTYECHLASGDLTKATETLETLQEMTANKPNLQELNNLSKDLLNEVRNQAV